MKLLWLDIETTGLHPDRDAFLEMAIAEADLADPFDIGPISNPVFRFCDEHTYGARCTSSTPRGRVIPKPDDGDCPACAMGDWARKTHGSSGLLEACAKSTTTLREFEEHLLTVVPEVADKADRPTLAGRSVHFDLGFLRVHMPELAARLSHRVYDVSAFALFCESLGMPRLTKGEAHRAHADLLESVDHGRACAEWLGFTEATELLVSERPRKGHVQDGGQLTEKSVTWSRQLNGRAKSILPVLARLVEQLGDENPLLSVIVERSK